AIYRALLAQWDWLEPLFDDPLVARRGYVERRAFTDAIARARHGITKNEVQLTGAIALELWLRTLDQKRAADEHACNVLEPPLDAAGISGGDTDVPALTRQGGASY